MIGPFGKYPKQLMPSFLKTGSLLTLWFQPHTYSITLLPRTNYSILKYSLHDIILSLDLIGLISDNVHSGAEMLSGVLCLLPDISIKPFHYVWRFKAKNPQGTERHRF